MIETSPEYFLSSKAGKPELVPFIIFEKDNSHGVQDISCRFAFTLLSLLYDFDYLKIGSQEAGYSMLHIVESMNGALSRRLNGKPFTLDLAAPESASKEELQKAEKLVLKEICKRATGASYKTGGGFITVKEARSTLLKSGFEFRPVELAAFLEAAKKGEAALYVEKTLKPMDGYSGDYGQLLLRAWRLLNASGVMQCTKTTAHGFHSWKNPTNPDCLPRRGPDSFFDFLSLFGDTFPQPKVSVLRPFVDAIHNVGHYMDLAERCSLAGRGATDLDEYYPKQILDNEIADATLSLIDVFIDGENALEDELRDRLCAKMCVDEATLYADLTERAAKMEYARKYKLLVAEQKADGTIGIVTAVCKEVLSKDANAPLPVPLPATWPRVIELKSAAGKLKIKFDKAAKRATLLMLIYKHWVALPQGQRDAFCSPSAAARARGQAGGGVAPTAVPVVVLPPVPVPAVLQANGLLSVIVPAGLAAGDCFHATMPTT